MMKITLKLTALFIGLSIATVTNAFEMISSGNVETTVTTTEVEQAQQVIKPTVTVIFVLSKDRKGLIRADLESAGATFADINYNMVLLNVGSTDKAQLIARANAELAASRTVVLDSDGSEAEIAIVSAVAQAVSGSGPKAVAVSIVQVQAGLMAVTPIETEAAYMLRQSIAGRPISAGNTARYAFNVTQTQ